MAGGRISALVLRAWPALLLAGCIPQGHPPADWQRSYPERQPTRPVSQSGRQVTALPAPPPAWEARPVTANARAIRTSTYIVGNGDTLRGIANKTGAGSIAIAIANNLSPPYTIFPGQKLTIPGGRYHQVRAGDTGIAIARAYGVPWSSIVAANDLEPPYILRTGQRILIPQTGRMTPDQMAAVRNLSIDDIVTGSEPAIDNNARPSKPTTSASRVLPSTAAVQPPARLTSGFRWPVSGRVVKQFGPGRQKGERNDGITISAPLNTPILAAANGVVVYVGDDVPTLGGLVMVKHGDDYTTVYGYADQLLVQRGQAVKKGQTLALSGQTGFADRPEVYFEIRKGRTPVDPMSKLPSR